MKNEWILALLHFVFLLDCSRNTLKIPSELLESDSPSGTFAGKTVEEARTDIGRAVVACEAEACSNRNALMMAIFQMNEEDPSKRYYVGEACTAALVKPQVDTGESLVFATAGHCIPKRFHNKAVSCSQDIIFALSDGRRLPCQEVLVVHSTKTTDPWIADYDLALVKVSGKQTDDLAGYQIAQSPSRVSVGAYPVKVIGADIEGDWHDTFSAKLKLRECFIQRNTFVLPETNSSPRPPFHVVRGCGIKKGYSGGPLLDGPTLLGTISFSSAFEEGAAIRHSGMSLPIPAGLIGVASNLACLNPSDFSYACDDLHRQQRVLFIDDEQRLDGARYLDFLLATSSLTMKQNLFQADLVKLKTLTEARPLPSGYGGPWIYKNYKTSTAASVRIPIPSCSMKKELARASYLTHVYLYSVIPHEDLSLEFKGRVIKSSSSLEIEYLGGSLRIFGRYWGDQWIEEALPLCGT